MAAITLMWSSVAAAQFTLTLQPNTIPSGTENVAYSQLITAVGGNAPYTFAVTSGSLPVGLALAPNGQISGTPTTPNSYSFTITATDVDGNTGFRPYTFSIGTAGGITINPASLPDATQGTPYSQTLTTTGSSGGNVFSIAAGSLPAGLSLNTGTGAITGTPTTGGTYNFTAAVRDSNGNTGSRAYSVTTIVPIVVSPSSLPNGTTGTPYSQTITASNGTGPYTFTVSAGALPNGLSLAAGGALTGTPTTPGTFNFTVQATDAAANTGSRAYSVQINSAPLTINPSSLPAGQVGTAYNQTVVASGGNGVYSYSVIAGSLPTGLSLNPGTGAITGTPSAGGTFNFTIQGTDTSPNTGSRAYSVTIGTNSLTVNPATLPNGTQSVPYSQTVTAAGGTGPYTYAVSAGALPAGLSLNAGTGAITGTPSGSGASAFTIRATDSLNNFGLRAYNVNIGTNSLTINPSTLPAAITGRPYSAALAAAGGTGPYTYTVTTGALPPGLSLNASTGAITGTVSGAGPFAFTISALDALGNTGSRAYTLTNRPDPATDPEVIGLVNAQAAAARRFAGAQVDNISRHLERLHNFNPCSSGFEMNLPPQAGLSAQDRNGGSSWTEAGRFYDGSKPPGSDGRAPVSGNCADSRFGSQLAGWVSGSVEFGTTLPDGSASRSRFTTAGLTAGIDWRVHADLVVGVSVGYGGDRTTVGSYGTQMDASSFSGAVYASYSALDPWFIDGTLGYGLLSFDNRRFSSTDSAIVSGERKGGSVFGAVSLGYEFKQRGLHWSPYLKADFLRAQLDQYAEQGAAAGVLTFGAATVQSAGATLGLRGSYDFPVAWGVITPTARAEYRQAIDGAVNQSLYYSDMGPGAASTVTQASAGRGSLNTSLGLNMRSSGRLNGFSGDIEYGTSYGGLTLSQTVRASLKMNF